MWRVLVTSLRGHVAAHTRGLEEFYPAATAATKTIASGRSWSVQELSLKSFDDLHQLWFTLCKERNMLETERWQMRKRGAPLADAGRLKKVGVV